MSNIDLDAVDALCEAATEGEWRWTIFPKHGIWESASLCAFDPDNDCSVGQGILFHYGAWAMPEGDRQLIEKAPMLIQALAAKVRELEIEIKNCLVRLGEEL